MSEAELKLRCLELAMQQAKIEGSHSNRENVVEIATAFYNHISPVPETASSVKGSRKSADKSPEIFK
jgi:hypothetical protein